MENFLHAPFPEEPLDFYGQSKERTNHELGLVQCSGVNHQVQFVADAESNASNTLNSGYCGYDNGEDLVRSYLELDSENWYSQNCELLDEVFGNTHAPIAIKHDHVLQSQSCVKNYGELPFDASILDVGSEQCTPDIGLPSGKSLFQLQAERILCVQKLAVQSTDGSAGVSPIHWYIMTSPFTDEATRKFFESHKYFGLEADQVTFFQQGTIPCVSGDGRFIMESPYKVAKAPDGNGGLYSALKSSKLLEDMAMRGVKYVDCYGVDNALVRVADPTFLGYFIDKSVSAAAKVVRKAYPQEKVGVFVQRGRGGPLTVLEYSEMDPSMACEINQITGRLRYCWSNVCLHMFTLDFLNQVANGLEKDSIYHLAEKKIPSIHGYSMGLKLEQFIFDAFAYAPSMALFEVLREEEFAPVKNANGASYDTPDSARLMLLRLHSRWVVAAGGFLTHSVPLYLTGVEISPLCSYAGENLEAICRGRTFHAPSEISF